MEGRARDGSHGAGGWESSVKGKDVLWVTAVGSLDGRARLPGAWVGGFSLLIGLARCL